MPFDDGTMTRREYLKMQHRCTQCATMDAYTLNGRTLCAECAEKGREKYRQNPEPQIRRAVEYQRRRRKIFEESGMCIICGKYAPSDGRKMCKNCSDRSNGYVKKHNKPLVPGMCSRCRSKPVLEGRKLCAACYEDVCRGLEKARMVAKAGNGGHAWRQYWEGKGEISADIPREADDACG